MGGPAALLLSKAKAFCTAAGCGFLCVFACSRGTNSSNGPRKYAMVLATLVLSPTVGLLMFAVLV